MTDQKTEVPACELAVQLVGEQAGDLCATIGNAVFGAQNSLITIFQGPAQTGKSTLCAVIAQIAKDNNVQVAHLSADMTTADYKRIAHEAEKQPTICIGHEVKQIPVSNWNIPTFITSNQPLKIPGSKTFRFLSPIDETSATFVETFDTQTFAAHCQNATEV